MKKIAIILTASLMFLSCKHSNEAGVTENSDQAKMDSMNVVIEKQKMDMAKQKSIDSMQNIVNQRPKTVVVHDRTTATQTTSVAPAAPARRKGWSGAAKGAVIGAGVGAIGGAIINHKDRGTGALIGGLAGAGLGAGTGAIIDAEKRRKAEAAAAAQQNP